MTYQQRRLGIVVSYVAMLVNIVIGVLYTPIILRIVGQREYGLYSLALSVTAYMTVLDLGLGSTYIRYTSRYRAYGDIESESKLNGLFLAFYTMIGVVAITIFLVLYNNIGVILNGTFSANEVQKLRTVIAIMAIDATVSFPLAIFPSFITVYERFVFLKMINIIGTILGHAIILLSLYYGYGLVGMAMVSVLFSIVTKLITMAYCFGKLKMRIGIGRLVQYPIREIVTFSFFVLINIVVDQLYINTDRVILGAFVGATEVAIYSVAMQFQSYFVQFSTAISGIFLPQVTMLLVAEDSKAVSDLFIRVSRFQFIILAFVMSGFTLFGKAFINTWAGHEYVKSYYIVLVVMFPAIVPLSQNLGIGILQAKNMHRFRSILYVVIALANVLVSIPLAKVYGGIGAAIGTSLAGLAGQVVTMNWYYHNRVGLDILTYWKEIGHISTIVLITSIFGLALNYIVPSNLSLSLVAKGGIYSGVFAWVAWKWILSDFEKQMCRYILSGSIGKTLMRKVSA